MRCLVSFLLVCCVGATNEFGLKFLEENAKKEGVVTLASGLQYKVLADGDGEEHPQPSTSCECHYEGRTAQEYSKEPKGKKFDSSYDRGEPTSFAPNQVIGGWTEAMQLMVQGDKWEMYIPSDLGYGDGGQGGDIGGGDVLVFTMEILKINGPTTPAERGPPAFSTLSSTAEWNEWLQTGGGKGEVFMLGLFRRPTIGDLFTAFKGSAKALKKQGGNEAALWAQSSFDSKTRKYPKSALEAQLGFSAPAVLITSDQGKSWIKCNTAHSTSSVEKIKGNIAGCVRAATGGEL